MTKTRPKDRPVFILRYIEIYKEDFDCRFLYKKSCLLVLIYGYNYMHVPIFLSFKNFFRDPI